MGTCVISRSTIKIIDGDLYHYYYHAGGGYYENQQVYQFPKTGTATINGYGVNVGQGSNSQFLYSCTIKNNTTQIYSASGLPGCKKFNVANVSVVKDTWLTASFQCHQSDGDFGLFYRVIYN